MSNKTILFTWDKYTFYDDMTYNCDGWRNEYSEFEIVNNGFYFKHTGSRNFAPFTSPSVKDQARMVELFNEAISRQLEDAFKLGE